MVCWITKAAIISETRKDRGKVTIDGLGTHQCSFERYHQPSPMHPHEATTSPSPRLGVRNPHSKLQSKVAGKRVRARIQIVCMVGIWIYLGGGRLGVKSVGIARDRPNFLATPIDSGTGKATVLTSNMAGAFIRCIRTKAH